MSACSVEKSTEVCLVSMFSPGNWLHLRRRTFDGCVKCRIRVRERLDTTLYIKDRRCSRG